MTEAKTSLKRTLIGKVVSDKRAKTVTVLIERRVKHELYGKIVGKSSKYHAHDEKGEYKLGDIIEITESKPISKTKNWVATRLVQKAGFPAVYMTGFGATAATTAPNGCPVSARAQAFDPFEPAYMQDPALYLRQRGGCDRDKPGGRRRDRVPQAHR